MATVARRDLQKEAAWRRRLRRQAESGQSVRAWCRRHRVMETAFYWWRKELARRDGERKSAARPAAEGQAASFVPVHVTREPGRDSDPEHRGPRDGDTPLEIVLTDGRRVRLTGPVNREWLAAVLDVLERRPC
jgi:hypothetical protein